ncbi:hypothetical protein VTJ04DRAFT_10139 [Mycothermus thermophilus]|uniref:uncharacterized protein n=1 Tax=Humicola insolens TaxID=85995 RepID=UPI003742EAD7
MSREMLRRGHAFSLVLAPRSKESGPEIDDMAASRQSETYMALCIGGTELHYAKDPRNKLWQTSFFTSLVLVQYTPITQLSVIHANATSYNTQHACSRSHHAPQHPRNTHQTPSQAKSVQTSNPCLVNDPGRQLLICMPPNQKNNGKIVVEKHNGESL